jgi:hypothetical protein
VRIALLLAATFVSGCCLQLSSGESIRNDPGQRNEVHYTSDGRAVDAKDSEEECERSTMQSKSRKP